MAELITIGVVFALLIGVLYTAYLKGKSDERDRQLVNSVDDLLASKKKQEKREAAHEKRVRDISDGPVSADDAGRMLSEWPDKSPYPPAPKP